MSVKILTDSTSYLTEDIRKQLDIEIICLNVTFEDESFKETDIDNETFYKKMEQKGIPMSSQPSITEIQDKMLSIINAGDEIIGVFISSDMSGTYATAHMVKDMILETNKDAKIEIVDSRSNSMQLGFAAMVGAIAAKEGKSLEEVKKVVEDNIKRSRFLFIPDNLTYLKKGGRIGGAGALIGNLLKIIPILTVEDGKTTVASKIRTKGKAMSTLLHMALEDISKYGLGSIAVHHINCMEHAKAVAKELQENLGVEVPIYDIGPVIGLHVGPGAIGVVYYTERDLR